MLAAILLFTASPLFAEGRMFGVKGGLNVANVTGADAEGLSLKMGFVGGTYLCYNITEVFAIQAEYLFSMKGAEWSDIIKFNFNYMEIPLLLKINIPTEGKIKPSLYAGPALGILMSAKAEVMSIGVDVDIKDYVKSTNLGLVAGAGVGYEMENKGLLFLEARYEIGMPIIARDMKFTVSRENTTGTTTTGTMVTAWWSDVNVKTSDFSIMAGYGFAF
jgi:hypothetical protein